MQAASGRRPSGDRIRAFGGRRGLVGPGIRSLSGPGPPGGPPGGSDSDFLIIKSTFMIKYYLSVHIYYIKIMKNHLYIDFEVLRLA